MYQTCFAQVVYIYTRYYRCDPVAGRGHRMNAFDTNLTSTPYTLSWPDSIHSWLIVVWTERERERVRDCCSSCRCILKATRHEQRHVPSHVATPDSTVVHRTIRTAGGAFVDRHGLWTWVSRVSTSFGPWIIGRKCSEATGSLAERINDESGAQVTDSLLSACLQVIGIIPWNKDE